MVLIEFDKVKHLIVFTVSGLTSLGGFIGIIVHGIYSDRGGPTYIKNEFIGLWLAAHLLFYSLQSFFIIFENSRIPSRQVCYYIDLIYFIITLVCGILIALNYELVFKHDATIWASFISFISLVNIVLVYSVNKVELKEKIIKRDLVLIRNKEDFSSSDLKKMVKGMDVIELNGRIESNNKFLFPNFIIVSTNLDKDNKSKQGFNGQKNRNEAPKINEIYENGDVNAKVSCKFL